MAWAINLASLLTFVVWLVVDARAAPSVAHLIAEVEAQLDPTTDPPPVASELESPLRRLRAGTLLAAGSLVGMMVGLIMGSRRQRSLRAWLLVTTVVSAWLATGLSWERLAWQGQQLRLESQLAEVDHLVNRLDAEWPPADGDIPELGAFLAYPIDSPTTLLLLRHARFPGTALEFSAVERTPDGALRFQLAGAERGAWLEWRPDASAPASFRSGVETYYDVEQVGHLGPHWHLVRYRPTTRH